jgi:hypothetical protein
VINEVVGESVEIDGQLYVKTKIGVKGCALYGPYVPLDAGSYAIEYSVKPIEKRDDAIDLICAGVDVVCDFGATVLAQSSIYLSQLLEGGRIQLAFDVPDRKENVEYRVFTEGQVRFLIGTAPWLIADRQLAREVRNSIVETFRRLRPQAVQGFRKKRFGAGHDGGYVAIDDFRTVDTVFSFGIEQNASWDTSIAQQGVTVYQFDHTVDAPMPHDSRMIFEKKKISAEAGPASESLVSLLKRHDKGRPEPNVLLKMDIENDEWPVFDATPPAYLKRFTQIICEFHRFENLSDLAWRARVIRVLNKISNAYSLIHVHANNYASVNNTCDVVIPNVIEMTFANRSLYSFKESDEVFPGEFDKPCDPARPDIQLGAFQF